VTDTVTYVQAITAALSRALEEDDRVIVMGEDVGRGGGAFRATAGLYERFGGDRVIDTPISEAAFTGAAVGMALDGMRPVVEFQFSDFLTSGMNAIINTAAKMHFRHGLACPLVVRAPAGGGFAGGPFHSQNPEAWFLRTPGLKVVAPATTEDASLLLGAAIADPNPVLFFEQKNLYTRIKGDAVHDASARVAGAAVRRVGDDVTVVSYGAAYHVAAQAAVEVAEEGISVDLVDLRVLCPLDFETIANSVAKTSRCLVVTEDYAEFGVGAEVVARVAGELFADLDAPPRRVGANFWPIPFSPPLERATLPDSEVVATALRDLTAF
jgi:pyruvate/2-oxoglutarate/acetoin dehydrogenase E1 component